MSTAYHDLTISSINRKLVTNDLNHRAEHDSFDDIPSCIVAGPLPATPDLPPTIPAEGKHIVCDPETGVYLMYLDAQLVGFARTYQEAEAALDELIDEIQLYTRVTTADMAAEAAELRLEAEAAA